MTNKVLLTGISGWIAKHIAIELLNSGYEVLGTVRSQNSFDKTKKTLSEYVSTDKLSFVELDLLKDDGWVEAAKDCKYIIHTASPYPMKSSRNREALVPAAKGGTLRVLNAGIEANVEKIILTSSIAAMFKKPNRTNPYTFGESDWSNTDWSGSNDYIISKTKAEQAAWELMESKGLKDKLTVPSCVVIVATIRALKMHGGVAKDDLKTENVEALKKGLVNLQRHVENVKKFGLPVAVAVNHFIKDTDNEVKALIEFCDTIGVKASLCTHWANGGEGTKELANHVAELCEKNEDKFKFLYESKTPLFKKIETIAKEIYRADEVIADTKIRDQLKSFEDAGYGDFPICIAKTQYSFSTDPSLKGAPTGHALPIREIKLSSGAEFIVVICGAVMTMPGLPRVPAADSIKLNKDGEIEGLF